MMKKNLKPNPETDYKLLFQRTLADFENYKKRVEADKAAWTDQAKIEFLEKLLPVLDNLALMAGHRPDDLTDNPWAEGVLLIAKQIEQTLSEEGITKIEPKPGDEFDPLVHEAVSTEQDSQVESDQIAKVQKPGYKIGDKVIRVAQVITKG